MDTKHIHTHRASHQRCQRMTVICICYNKWHTRMRNDCRILFEQFYPTTTKSEKKWRRQMSARAFWYKRDMVRMCNVFQKCRKLKADSVLFCYDIVLSSQRTKSIYHRLASQTLSRMCINNHISSVMYLLFSTKLMMCCVEVALLGLIRMSSSHENE